MGKNIKGGKKHKRAKNINFNEKIEMPEDGQYFGKVIKLLGSGRVNLDYYFKRTYKNDNLKNDNCEWTRINKIGVIRGNMMKRIYINIGDIVLVTPRDFEDKKVDIICKYSVEQFEHIKKHMDTPNIDGIDENEIEFDSQIDDEIIDDVVNDL